MNQNTNIDGGVDRRRNELLAFIVVAVVLAPVLTVVLVGGYGFAVWMLQLLGGT